MFKFKGLYALYYRELHNMRGAWFTIITPFVTSLLFLFLFGLSIGPLIGDLEYRGGPVDYLLFFLPGVIGMGVVYSAMSPGGFLDRINQLELLRISSPVQYPDLLIYYPRCRWR
jgi:hypothetical protein